MRTPFLRRRSVLALTLVFVSLSGLGLASASGQRAPATQDIGAIDAYLQVFMEQNRVPGLALAIVQDDQILYAHGYGSADPAGREMTAQTPFVIGSTSKAFTALAVMQLVEAGQIDLDALVVTYLPWFQVGSEGAAAAITVRQLLNHTSGIPEAAGETSLSVNAVGAEALEQQVRSLSRWALVFAPGTGFEYANANYQTAGLIVQVVAGEPFETYVQQQIFDPLGMGQSYTSPAEAQAHGLAGGYNYWFGRPISAGNIPDARGHFPSGGFISTAEDLAHAVIAHLNGGQYAGHSLISVDGMAELHRSAQANYAMGWDSNPPLLWHEGAVAASGSHIILDTRRQLGVVVLFNINNALGAEHLYTIAPSVFRILTDLPIDPPPTSGEYRSLAALLGVLLVGALVWVAVSWWLLRRWQREPARRPRGLRAALWLGAPLIIELGLAIYLLTLLSPSLGVALLYQPDLTLLALVIVGLLVVWGAVRTFGGARLVGRRAA